ncbi:unnamed protein product [Blepharisma stoltei]|uniref:Uncharacterized protein n=1 Tax=Blepharisma stoltei TaxID=1481888 RepID=A0AAU9K1J3_9CILI|nr:unnamed protein product [Blepharisma stoltei]
MSPLVFLLMLAQSFAYIISSVSIGTASISAGGTTTFTITLTDDSGTTCSSVSSINLYAYLTSGSSSIGAFKGTTSSSCSATITTAAILTPGTYDVTTWCDTCTSSGSSSTSSSALTVSAALSKMKISLSTSSTTAQTAFGLSSINLYNPDGSAYGSSATITFSLLDSSATLTNSAGSTSTLSNGGNLSNVFKIDKAGTYTIQATDGTIYAYSDPITITVGSVNSITIDTISSQIVNKAFTITYSLYDAGGNKVTSDPTTTLSGSGVTQISHPSFSFSAYCTSTGSITITLTSNSKTQTSTFTVNNAEAQITLPNSIVVEGETNFQYKIHLIYQPYNDMVITIAPSDSTQFTLSATSLTFTSSNYATDQTVTVSVLRTSNSNSQWTSKITHSVTTYSTDFVSSFSAVSSSGDLTLTVFHEITTAVIIDSVPVMVEGGTSVTYHVYLSQAPTADVRIAISTSGGDLTISPTNFFFTSSTWDQSNQKTVTVTAPYSSYNTGGINSYTLTHAISADDPYFTNAVILPTPCNAYVIKKDTSAVLISESVVFQEGLTGSYSIVLTTEPQDSVTISLSSTSTMISFSPTSLVFTKSDYDIPQSISLSSVEGSSPRGLQYSITITHTVTSGDSSYNGITPIPGNDIKVTAVNPCRGGLWAWPPGTGKCNLCPQGYKCPTLYGDKVACSSNQYSPLGVWNCIDCPPGHSCDGTNMPKPCDIGYTAAWGSGVCTACTGVSCDLHGHGNVAVPDGMYIRGDGHSLYQCPPGSKCTGGSYSTCSSGQYSPPGSSTCISCPSGAYCPNTSSSLPVLCDPYSYSTGGTDTCHYCPVGYSCTSSGKTACASGKISLEGWMECLTCDVLCHGGGSSSKCSWGQYLDSSNICQTCDAGYECDGTYKKPCPLGYYSSSGASGCIRCAIGTYSNTIASTACTSLSTTKATIANMVHFGEIGCYRGSVKNSGGYACTSCPPGKNCDNPFTTVTCPVGYFCPSVPLYQSSAATQTPCPSGYYTGSTGGTSLSSCSSCAAGYYCTIASSAETTCPAGHYCLAYTSIPDMFPCPEGYYRASTGGAASSDCSACTQGYFCPEGTSVQYPCPAGTWCAAQSAYVNYCAAGTTSAMSAAYTSGSCSGATCTAGYYCTPGSAPLPCPIGTYNTNTGKGFVWDACTFCDAGYACKQMGQSATATTSCDAGHYCPEGTEFARQFPCPAGYYSDSTSLNEASGCFATNTSPDIGSCTAGKYCPPGTVSTTQISCPRGYYCSLGTVFSHTTPCSAGYYSWSRGNAGDSDCTICPSGRYCIRGASQVSGYCSQGYYCASGSTLPDNKNKQCGDGKYQPYYNATSSSDCKTCPAGSFCWAGSAFPILCPAGTYSSASTGSDSSCSSCTAGQYCPQGTASGSLLDCPAGYYSNAGASTCTICPNGYYCEGATSGTTCPSGKFCPIGTSVDPTSDSDYDCPAGYYCASGTTSPTPCSVGKYNPDTGKSSSSDCTSADAGYYSLLGSSSNIGYCEPGYYCPEGSTGPYQYPCPAGYYRFTIGATDSDDCSSCTAGYYCPLGTASPIICPIGYYCESSSSTPAFCPSGTVGLSEGLTSSSACTDCPTGSYCSTPGLLVPDGSCTQGYSCDSGSSSSTPTGSDCTAGGYCEPGFPAKRNCPPGSYNPNEGAKDVSWCLPCTAGYYCLGSESDISTNLCAAGYYCPTGSFWSKQNITPSGSYTTSGQYTYTQCALPQYNPIYAQSTCIDCPQGFYCNANGMTDPIVCPVGSYCITNQSYYTQCPIGTFNPRLALTQQSDCLYCLQGYFCPTTGLSSLSSRKCDPGYYCYRGATVNKPSDANTASGYYGICPAGAYCPQGSAGPIACPSGYMRSSQLGTQSSDCTQCTQGYYCTNVNSTTTTDQCDAGYYCFAGSRWQRPYIIDSTHTQYCAAGEYCLKGSYEPTDCPSGTYQDLDYQSTCNTCPAGYYCPQGTSDYSVLPCPAGYYCPSGTQYNNQYPCPSGTYNPRTGITDSSMCLQCPPGKYCQDIGQSTYAGTCTGGYFCKKGSKSATPQVSYPGDSNGGKCIAGYYCPAGAAYAFECDGGYYCATGTLNAPTGQCSAGYYCIGGSTTDKPTDGTHGNICPAGYYCPIGSISPIACPKGTYLGSKGNDDVSDCINCPAGEYCGDSGLSAPTGSCAAGFYCSGSNYEYMPLSGKCTAGNYCPAGSGSQTSVSPGYYQDQTMQSTYKKCPQGYYCPSSGMTTPTACEAGYYCPQGSINHLECPAGTYNEKTQRWQLSDCLSCPPGKYCEGTSNVSWDGDCQEGYYCRGGAVQKNPNNDAQGGKCPKGYYCPAGSVLPTKCTPGSYCATTTLDVVSGSCTQGYYCLEGATSPTPRDGVTGAVCPVGYYCPSGSAMPTPCDPGYYQSSQQKYQSSDCIICPAGYYCAHRASSVITGICTAGYYCPQGQITPTPIAYICPIGNYCPSRSATQTSCAAGTYQDQKGQSSCKNCPAGFYCDAGATTPTKCTAGYMCPLGTSSSTRVPCGNGEYQPFEGQSSCLTCPMGYECGAGPLTSPTTCPIYSYCVAGTNSPAPSCPSGTYTDETGLQSKSQCKQCPAGKYCTNGKIQADCDAGYYCISGCNTPTPDSYTNTGYGQPCPEGHYCLAGATLPTPCPSGKFRTQTGGAQSSDCTDCDAGYYCIANDPVPKECPAGAYCPAGSNTPTYCNAGYYSLYPQQSSSTTCTICPSGYLCLYQGTADYSNYPCSPGYYCTTGTLSLTSSPAGVYSPGYKAGSVSDLVDCPSGYYCVEQSTGYNYCVVGEYCPTKSSTPSTCSSGNYCDNVSSSPTACPAGWYCPGYTSEMSEYPPLICPDRKVCKQSCSSPVTCDAGYYVITATTIVNVVTPSCNGCPPGKYSTDTTEKCYDCSAGYMCTGETPTPTPVNLDTGYQCAKGYYCPVGALKEYACPEGTYSIDEALTSLSACTNCPVGKYNDLPGQTSCKTCGTYATSKEGASQCTCIGNYRVYLQATGYCVCQTGYEYIDSSGNDLSDKNGKDDCVQKVYTRCNSGDVRDQLGKCRSTSDCSSECNGGSGERSPSTGLCECTEVDDVNNICNENCRDTSNTMTYNSGGQFVIYNPTTGKSEAVASTDVDGLQGSAACYPGKSCKVHSVEMTSSGKINGLFGVTSSVKSSKSSSRILATTDSSKYIQNPVICLNIGETMAFSVIKPDHYPVYMKKSLINSNPTFDYSEFTALADSMKNGENITVFVFTFNQGGVYLFADAADTSQQMIVGVMTDSSECPYSDSQLQPRTAASIHLIRTNLKGDIIQSVDWKVVVGLMISLVVAVLIFTALFYYYTKFTWEIRLMKRVPYREQNKHLKIIGDEGTRTTMQLVIDGKEAGSDSSEVEEIREMIFEKVPEVASFEPTNYLDEHNQVDNSLIQAIKEKIRNNNKLVMKFLEDSAADSQDRLQRLANETEELRNLLYDLLNPLSKLVGKPAKKTLDDKLSARDESIIGSAPTTLIPDIEYQEALNEIAENGALIDQDKNKLMSELNSELQKLEENIKADKSKHDDELAMRLALRAKRRKELEREKKELEREEKNLAKAQQNEIWEAKMVFDEEEKALQEDFNREKEEIRRTVLGSQVAELQDKLQKMIEDHPEKTQEYIRQYEQHVEALENNLTINQMRQHQELVKRLEEKKNQRRAQLKEKQAKMEAEIKNKQAMEREEIEQKKKDLEIEEAIAEALPIVTKDQTNKELEDLEKKHKDELIEYEKELKTQENQEVTALQKQATMKESKLTQLKADLEKQKKKLMESVATATDEEKDILYQDLAMNEMKLKELAEKVSQEQKKNLDDRLEFRRKKRDERLKALKQKQEEERKAVELQAKNKANENKAIELEQAIKQALSKLPVDKQNDAIKALLEEKHEQERLKLKKKLRKKLRDCQKDAIREVMRMKASDLEILRNEFKEKVKAAGRDSEALSQIQQEETEALNRIDYHYMKQLESSQEDAWRKQSEKNQQELLSLIDHQLGEMRKYANSQGPNQGSEDLELKLQQERQRVEDEGQRKLNELNKRKEELEALRAQKQKELEEMIMREKRHEEMENRRQLLIEKKRALMEKQRKIREELQKRGQLTSEQMERLISEHQRELSALESAIARERDRQMALMSQKLAERMQRKNEYEMTVQRMKEEQSRWQKEMEELPGITNKQATTLLLKWRRYPKRGIKDIEKTLRTVEPAERQLPVVAKMEDAPVVDSNDPRLDELVAKVDRIEKIVKNVDSTQFENAIKALEELERTIKSVKSL